ncbi:MAG: molybdenum cofactor biosynthesis protein MoaE [Actinomycetota bacterium]|nr:molybdenum cofactor biosynthesis protein MoaE [Actinomycetota bacterium]
MPGVAFARIAEEPLDLTQHLEAVSGPGFGAVVTFVGQIRDHDPEATGTVELVEYSHHPDAEVILERIAAEVATAETRLAVSHRTGPVEVGQPALIACVASAHRAPAYEVSRDLVERIKKEVPIWKRQLAADGRRNWQGIR